MSLLPRIGESRSPRDTPIRIAGRFDIMTWKMSCLEVKPRALLTPRFLHCLLMLVLTISDSTKATIRIVIRTTNYVKTFIPEVIRPTVWWAASA